MSSGKPRGCLGPLAFLATTRPPDWGKGRKATACSGVSLWNWNTHAGRHRAEMQLIRFEFHLASGTGSCSKKSGSVLRVGAGSVQWIHDAHL